MFHFERLLTKYRTAQVIDFIRLVRLFDLFGFSGVPARKNHAGAHKGREGTEISYYTYKWNKWNSRTRQVDQRLSVFQTVPHCSALVASTSGARSA